MYPNMYVFFHYLHSACCNPGSNRAEGFVLFSVLFTDLWMLEVYLTNRAPWVFLAKWTSVQVSSYFRENFLLLCLWLPSPIHTFCSHILYGFGSMRIYFLSLSSSFHAWFLCPLLPLIVLFCVFLSSRTFPLLTFSLLNFDLQILLKRYFWTDTSFRQDFY